MKELFTLHGVLANSQKLILGIIGIVILICFWWLLSIGFANEDIKVMDGSTSSRYTSNEDLIYEDFDALLDLSDDKLAELGLAKIKHYNVLPTPIDVLKSFKELVNNDDLFGNTLKSLGLNFFGYIIAITISIPLGFLLGLIPLFRGLFGKVVDASRFIPLTAVTGIFILWFGLESKMKVLFLAFGIIVYLVPIVIQRIDEVKEIYLKTVHTLGASNFQKITSVYFPSVISRISDDVRVLTAISWTYITIAEMLNKSGGIGELIWLARRQSRIDKAFAVLIVIVVIGLLQDKIFTWIDRLFFPYKYVNRVKK